MIYHNAMIVKVCMMHYKVTMFGREGGIIMGMQDQHFDHKSIYSNRKSFKVLIILSLHSSKTHNAFHSKDKK